MKLTPTQLRRIIKEEMMAVMPGGKDPQRFLHGFESGHPMDDEGYMVKSRMSDVKEMAETICDLLETGDQLPAWVQDLVASAHTNLEHVKDYLSNDEKMRAYGEKKPALSMGESSMPHMNVTDEEIMEKYGHLRGEMRSPQGQSRVYDRLLKDTMSQNYADTVFDRMSDMFGRQRNESRDRLVKRLSEGHARITQEEFAAWKNGDWGFVSEHDGGGPNPRRRGRGGMGAPPQDPVALSNYIIRNYQGHCYDLGVDDVSDPVFKEYVADQLTGQVDHTVLDQALSML